MFQGPIPFIVLLGVLVTVHELGHFLVAKACGVKVLRFSVGFGPRLVGFTKGETEYQIALLPLGGYVKMAGDMPQEELAPEEAHRGFLAQPPWKRALIVVAGPAFNLLFPILIYFLVFVQPHPVTSTRVGSVSPGLPAAAAGIRPGDRIVAVDGEPVRTFEELQQALVGRYERPLPLTVEREGKTSVIEVSPLRRTDTNAIDTVERGVLGVSPLRWVPVLGVAPGAPAWEAGLRTFDQVLTINGVPVPDEAALYEQLARAEGPLELAVQRAQTLEVGAVSGRAPQVLRFTVDKQPGTGLAALGAEPVDLYVSVVWPGSAAERAGLQVGDRLLALDGERLPSFHYLDVALGQRKAQPFELTWRTAQGQERTARLTQAPVQERDELGNVTASPPILGVQGWRPVVAQPEDTTLIDLDAPEALRQAALIVPQNVALLVKVLGGLVTGKVSSNTLGGPIMMYQLASKSAELGWEYFLRLMAIISINLGVMNLLPIPILDGFHLLAAGWEGIRRRPIPVRVREVANMVGLAMLILLMALAFKNDVLRLLS